VNRPAFLSALLAGASLLSATDNATRVVHYHANDIIAIHAKMRYTTLIEVPEGEKIMEAATGDKDFWVISATHNIAHIKPAKEGAATNLNLVAASGAVYSFLLSEQKGIGTPDLKVYVNADTNVTRAKPKYYTAAQFDGVQAELLEARNTVEAERRRVAEAIATYQQDYPSKLQFVYGTPKYDKPFLVRSIWHDGQFTYVKTDASELPALYEIQDGKPALVNFQVRNGTYVVPKVVERGYLALGKAQFSFAHQGR